MLKLLQALLLLGSVSLTQLATGQVISQQFPDEPVSNAPELSPCGTSSMEGFLAAHPKMRERVEANEAHTRQYIEQARSAAPAGTTAQKGPIGPPPPLITIPVVVHNIYSNAAQFMSQAVIQGQIDELNRAFSGQLSPGPRGQPVPAAFAPLVADTRIRFCLATRDPNGNPTTGITRTNNASFPQYDSLTYLQAQRSANGGKDAWNTAHYLNIWCFNNGRDPYGAAYLPFASPSPYQDGILLDYRIFGSGHAALHPKYSLGRLAAHEAGHWLGLEHIWGGNGSSCTDSDYVDDTPNQNFYNLNNPVFPTISCGNGPNGDMFMNHMDYVNDDSKLMFTTRQALRMQASIAPGGYRHALNNSPGLGPPMSIIVLGGTVPNSVLCGDRTPFRLNAGTGSVGCGGGYLRYEWSTSDNTWTIDRNDAYGPMITPSGTSGTVITLTGIYTNGNAYSSGLSVRLAPVSVTINLNPSPATPVFTSSFSHCAPSSYLATVTPVPGAAGYLWGVPLGFTPIGQFNTGIFGIISTSAPSLTMNPVANLAAGIHSISCIALGNCGGLSTPATLPLTVNGGPQLQIVDANSSQNTQGVVCQRNRLYLRLLPTGPVVPGAGNTSIYDVRWTVNSSNATASVTYDASLPLLATCNTPDVPNTAFTITATYYDICRRFRSAVSYTGTTASVGINGQLSNGYNCNPNQWRQASPAPTGPYPNPAANTLQLPGYQGTVLVYNQQGQQIHSLLAPGTATGATVDTRTWPEGLYVVTGRNLRGEFERHNVQIQH